MPISRRTVLKGLGSAGAIPLRSSSTVVVDDPPLRVAGRPVEVTVTPIGLRIIRVSVIPMEDGRPAPIPGADGRFLLYEDDGISFGYRKGDWMGIELAWNDQTRRLSLRLADGSRMRPPLERRIEVQRVPEKTARSFVFTGKPHEI